MEYIVDNIKSQMRKGLLEYCILLILNKKEAYASSIIEELKQANMIVVEGTLYPLPVSYTHLPSLANSLYEALADKYRKLTKLEQVDDAGDLYVLATIEGYDVSATAITADEVAAKNRLTVSVKVKFVNEKYPEENFEKNFAGYEDYDSQRSLDEVEATLCDTIIEKIVEDIFNATVANW